MRLLALALLAACATVAPPALTMPSAAVDPGAPVTRIAFGSCNKQFESQAFWEVIAEADPDLFVYLGDNVYGDVRTDDPSLPELRAAYDDLATNGQFASFRQAVPVLPVWDDHDYGRNDAGADFPLKAASEALFEDVWALDADDPRRGRAGVYHAETFGPEGQRVQLILLDTRYHRSALTPTDERGAMGRERYLASTDLAQTMLGAEQLAWLEDALSDPADLRVLVTSVQLIADGHGWEAWATMPLARERLYAMLADAQADGPTVVVVSGDRHRGGLYRTEAGGGLTELTASSLNDGFDGGRRRGRIGSDRWCRTRTSGCSRSTGGATSSPSPSSAWTGRGVSPWPSRSTEHGAPSRWRGRGRRAGRPRRGARHGRRPPARRARPPTRGRRDPSAPPSPGRVG